MPPPPPLALRRAVDSLISGETGEAEEEALNSLSDYLARPATCDAVYQACTPSTHTPLPPT